MILCLQLSHRLRVVVSPVPAACPLRPLDEATGSTTGEQIPEDRRTRWISAMHGLLQHLPQWLQHNDNYNRRDALNIMSDLSSSWPSCPLCINADAVGTSYLVGLHRLFLEAKLAEKDHQTALQKANARAHEMETICLDPLARHLHQLFHTDDDLFFDVYFFWSAGARDVRDRSRRS